MVSQKALDLTQEIDRRLVKVERSSYCEEQSGARVSCQGITRFLSFYHVASIGTKCFSSLFRYILNNSPTVVRLTMEFFMRKSFTAIP